MQQQHGGECLTPKGEDRGVELAAGLHDAAVSYDKAAEDQQPYRHEFFAFHRIDFEGSLMRFISDFNQILRSKATN